MLNDNVTNDNSDNGGLPPPPSFAPCGQARPALSPLSLVIIVIKDFGCHCHRPLPQSRIYAQAFQRLEMLPGDPFRAHFFTTWRKAGARGSGKPLHGREKCVTFAADSDDGRCAERSERLPRAVVPTRQSAPVRPAEAAADPRTLRSPTSTAACQLYWGESRLAARLEKNGEV